MLPSHGPVDSIYDFFGIYSDGRVDLREQAFSSTRPTQQCAEVTVLATDENDCSQARQIYMIRKKRRYEGHKQLVRLYRAHNMDA